jgi:hypothetical protein
VRRALFGAILGGAAVRAAACSDYDGVATPLDGGTDVANTADGAVRPGALRTAWARAFPVSLSTQINFVGVTGISVDQGRVALTLDQRAASVDFGDGGVPPQPKAFDAVIASFTASGETAFTRFITDVPDASTHQYSGKPLAKGNDVYATAAFEGNAAVQDQTFTRTPSDAGINSLVVSFMASGTATVRHIRGSSTCLPIVPATNGGIHAFGNWTNTLTYGATTFTRDGGGGLYAASLFASGEKLTDFPGEGFLTGLSAGVNASGDVFLGGGFDGKRRFGDIELVSEGGDGFIVGMDALLATRWAVRLGGPGTVAIKGIASVPGTRDVIVVGELIGLITLPDGSSMTPRTVSANDLFVLRVADGGRIAWHRVYGSDARDNVVGLHVDGRGLVTFGGTYRGQGLDFGRGALPYSGNGGTAIFFATLTLDGDAVDSTQFGDGTGQTMQTMTGDDSGAIYAAGVFNGTLTLPPRGVLDSTPTTLTAPSNDAIFVMKLAP